MSEETEDWGKTLSRIITASEARVAHYKKLVGESYRSGDRGLVPLFKALRQAEEKYLKAMRLEKTNYNAGLWFHPTARTDYKSIMESEDKILEILESL